MTPPIDDPEALRQILANTEALLLDFDGPICSVFSGIPAPVVADQLRNVLAEGGHTGLPENVRTAADPFDVLFYAAKIGQDEARYVEAAFRAHEVEAVQSAEPTPHAHVLMTTWKASGRPLAVVSNNSAAAVETYLDIHKCRADVSLISARSDDNINLLKPNPFLLASAANQLSVTLPRCAMIGDSATDMQASRNGQAMAVGFANKPAKADDLAFAGALAIVTDMNILRTTLELLDE